MTELFMPTLQTERLIIRRFTLDDLDDIQQVYLDAGWVDASLSPEDALALRKQWLEWQVINYDELEKLYQPPYGDRAVVLRETSQLIGSVGLVPAFGPFGTLPSFVRLNGYEERQNTAEIGLFWAIKRDYWRSGYASEAAAEIIRWTFECMKLSRLIATTADDNLASQGVMRKLGMSVEHNPHPEPVWFQTIGVLINGDEE